MLDGHVGERGRGGIGDRFRRKDLILGGCFLALGDIFRTPTPLALLLVATWLTGWYADHGPHGSAMANMSHFIAYGGFVYLAGGLVLLLTVFTLARRDVAKWTRPPS